MLRRVEARSGRGRDRRKEKKKIVAGLSDCFWDGLFIYIVFNSKYILILYFHKNLIRVII